VYSKGNQWSGVGKDMVWGYHRESTRDAKKKNHMASIHCDLLVIKDQGLERESRMTGIRMLSSTEDLKRNKCI
jgi:hypothetical protein